MKPLALHQDDPLVTDPALVALELARDAHRAVDVAAARIGGHRRQQERIFMDQRRGVKALGELFGDEARVEVAGNEPGCRLRAAWKARFDEMPRMTKPFSASCIRAMAWARVAPWVMSLAIIES